MSSESQNSPASDGGRRTRCKCLSDIRGFVALMSLFAIFQGCISNGMVPAVLSTLELRYGLSSIQSGAILSTYNIVKVIMAIPCSYALGKGHIPRNMALCCVVVVLGSFLFASAELFGSKYVPAGSGGTTDLCSAVASPRNCGSPETSGLYYLLLVGQGLIALGATAPYSIGPAYIITNVEAKRAIPMMGLFYGAGALGPAMGFLGGGALLSAWVDPSGLPAGFEKLTPSDTQWVGNWWLGILFAGTMVLVLTPFFVVFPNSLPSAPQPTTDEPEPPRSLKDVFRLAKDILTNPSWCMLTLAIASEAFAVAGYTGFGPKYLQTQFSLQAGTASIIAGGVIVPAAVIGATLGGWLDGRRHTKLSDTASFNSKMALISTVFVMVCAIFGCDNSPINGWNRHPPSLNLTAGCNAMCNCDQTYAPICGADGVAFFNSCWGGCANSTKGQAADYINCQCVFSSLVNVTDPALLSTATAKSGACGGCTLFFALFMLTFFLFLLFTFMNHTPSTAILLRIVPSPQHKALSMGLNDLFYKLLGSIPGPLIFGASFDSACILQPVICGQSETCAVYDNVSTRLVLLLLLGGLPKILSTIFNFLSIRTIRKHEARGENKKTIPENPRESVQNAALSPAFLGEIAGQNSRARLSSTGEMKKKRSVVYPEAPDLKDIVEPSALGDSHSPKTMRTLSTQLTSEPEGKEDDI